MEEKGILVKTIIQRETWMESGDQEITITRIITRITKDWVTQGLIVSLNKDRLDRLKLKNS